MANDAFTLLEARLRPDKKLDVAREAIAEGRDPLGGRQSLAPKQLAQLSSALDHAQTAHTGNPLAAWESFTAKAVPLLGQWETERQEAAAAEARSRIETQWSGDKVKPRHEQHLLPGGRARKGIQAAPAGGGNRKARALYIAWSDFVNHEDNKLNTEQLAACWTKCDAGKYHSPTSVIDMHYRLNHYGTIGNLFVYISENPKKFFDQLEQDIRAIRPDAIEPYTIPQETRDMLANAMRAAIATYTPTPRTR